MTTLKFKKEMALAGIEIKSVNKKPGNGYLITFVNKLDKKCKKSIFYDKTLAEIALKIK